VITCTIGSLRGNHLGVPMYIQIVPIPVGARAQSTPLTKVVVRGTERIFLASVEMSHNCRAFQKSHIRIDPASPL